MRKLAAVPRRRRARAEAARLAGAPITAILNGRGADDLARRERPAWPWPDPGAEFSADPAGRAERVIAAADGIVADRLLFFEQIHDVGRPGGGFRWDYRPPGEALALFGDDPRFPWEVARWAALPRLGAAFALTGRAVYAEKAAALVGDWAARVPVGEGPHYSSALEVGIRLIAAAQTWHFFRATSGFPGPVMETLLRQAAAQAAWLEGHLSLERVVAGNHLIGELAGLSVVDLVWPEFGQPERLDRSLALLAREFERQVGEDGASLEQSATYGRFVADFAAAVLGAAAAAGRPAPAALVARAAALAGWLEALGQPDGTLPLVGDNDNGRGADWGEAGPSHDARPVAAMLRRLTGGGGGPPGALRHFPRCGHAVLAPRPGDYLFVRCGPFGHGLPRPSAHSHADWMAPIVWLDDAPLLVDPGNFGYTTVGPARDRFRAEEAHSGLSFPGHPMASPGAAFRWNDIPAPGSLETAGEGPEPAVTGRWRTADGMVAARRTLRYNISQRLIVIEDDWSVSGGSLVQPVWHWRFAPGLVLSAAGGSGVEIRRPVGGLLLLNVTPAATLRLERGAGVPGLRAASRRPPSGRGGRRRRVRPGRHDDSTGGSVSS